MPCGSDVVGVADWTSTSYVAWRWSRVTWLPRHDVVKSDVDTIVNPCHQQIILASIQTTHFSTAVYSSFASLVLRFQLTYATCEAQKFIFRCWFAYELPGGMHTVYFGLQLTLHTCLVSIGGFGKCILGVPCCLHSSHMQVMFQCSLYDLSCSSTSVLKVCSALLEE